MVGYAGGHPCPARAAKKSGGGPVSARISLSSLKAKAGGGGEEKF